MKFNSPFLLILILIFVKVGLAQDMYIGHIARSSSDFSTPSSQFLFNSDSLYLSFEGTHTADLHQSFNVRNQLISSNSPYIAHNKFIFFSSNKSLK